MKKTTWPCLPSIVLHFKVVWFQNTLSYHLSLWQSWELTLQIMLITSSADLLAPLKVFCTFQTAASSFIAYRELTSSVRIVQYTYLEGCFCLLCGHQTTPTSVCEWRAMSGATEAVSWTDQSSRKPPASWCLLRRNRILTLRAAAE